MRLRASTGEIVRGRCRSTNLCSYCAKLAAVENSELLAIDGMQSAPPTLYATLTTSSTNRDPRAFYRSREQLQRALKRRWPDCEYAALLEFTTGFGPRAGGKRRPHWNLLLKGIPVEDEDQVRDVIASVWCPRVGGTPAAQHVGPIHEFGGLMKYLALHFQKESQAPPAGWSGHRFMHSRGYLHRRTPQLREQAREQLRYRREVYKLKQAGVPADQVDVLAELARQVARETTWELVQVYSLSAAPPTARLRPRAAKQREGRAAPASGALALPRSRAGTDSRRNGVTDALPTAGESTREGTHGALELRQLPPPH